MGPTALRGIRATGDTLSNVESQVFTPYKFGSKWCHMVEYLIWSLPDIVAFLEFVLTNDTGSGASKILRSVLAYSIPYESIAGEKGRFKDLQSTIDHLIENQNDLSLSEVV